MPTLSIIIPAFNEERYIGRCLQSVLQEIALSGQDIEVVVVNNASTDATRDIIASYREVKIVDEERKGLVRARQAGYQAATGDLIANVDADNILPHGWIMQVLKEFSQNTKLVALSGPLVYYDLSFFTNLQVKLFYIVGYITYLVNHFILKKSGMLQGGNCVLRKSALASIGGYDTTIDFYGEDTDIARRMQGAGFIKFSFRLKMYSSGRRMAHEGTLITGFRYALNYLWIIIFKKPFHTASTDVRVDSRTQV